MEFPVAKPRRSATLASVSLSPRAPHPIDYFGWAILSDNADVNPAGLLQLHKPFDVPRILRSVRSMLVTVVLDRDHHVFPSHVEKCKPTTVFIPYGNLRSGSREACVDQ